MSVQLTDRQQEVLDFIRDTQQRKGRSPTLRDICIHFDFRSPKAAADHVSALERKGMVSKEARRARSLRILTPLQKFLRPVVNVPIYGTIPAGFAVSTQQEAAGCVSLDMGTLGVRSTENLFALRVRGDSMIGKHIVDGDLAVLEAGRTPKNGDVVAALIDGESTLKTFAMERGSPVLRAENPRYSKLLPAQELEIQGVMVALIRAGARR